jgi:hypothetical protein
VAAEALDGESGDCVALAIIQSDRTADSRVQTAKFGYAHASHAREQVCLDKAVSRFPPASAKCEPA